MASSSLRFRCKPVMTEMRKPDGHTKKDPTIKQYCGRFSSLCSKPLNGRIELLSHLSYATGKSKVYDNHDLAKKRKFNKIEIDPTNKFRNECHINVEPSSRRKSSNRDDLALRLSPPDTNRKNEPFKQGGSSSQSQRESNHCSSLEFEFEHEHGPTLILMGCLNCHLYVMVSDANPKCPKCCSGDGLLDIFRVETEKKARTEIAVKKARTI